MSIKESIGWTDQTCNPIKGMCKGGCWYCYMYKMKRLKPEVRLELTAFDKLPKKKHKKIFLCSTHEIFGEWIPKEWRDAIFQEIEKRPHLTFQILTKFPENIDRPMPDNVWLGCTVTGKDDMWKSRYIDQRARITFVSIEPMIKKPPYISGIPKWIIIGALTGKDSKLFSPKREWIEDIVEIGKMWNIPIFLKDNLRSVWGDDLIQQMPEEEWRNPSWGHSVTYSRITKEE